jgi:hypothetical protein
MKPGSTPIKSALARLCLVAAVVALLALAMMRFSDDATSNHRGSGDESRDRDDSLTLDSAAAVDSVPQRDFPGCVPDFGSSFDRD